MGALQALGRPAEAEVRTMERLKKWGVFLVLLALVGSGAALLFWDLGAECLSVLRTGTGQTQYGGEHLCPGPVRGGL